jgi:hypothetical protein
LWDKAQFQNPATDISTNRWAQLHPDNESIQNYFDTFDI